MARFNSFLLSLLAGLGLLVLPAYAQQTTGTINGQVTDPSGAVVANVPVQLTGTGSGVSRTSNTNDQGSYSFQDVPYRHVSG